ncbi:MAG: hypothetical protein KKF44_07000 [Nanoarchaeota archaeon]|nr:hypothetical protein [Nanoarchaeota archaeon]
MIGNPKWFTRRKYGGWGLRPKTWQGWVYLIIMLGPFIIFQSLPFWDEELRTYVTIGWLAFMLLDVMHIMVLLKRDEREFKIEAVSERNAAWTMMLILVAGIMFQTIKSGMNKDLSNIDWFLVAALFGGMIAKTISNVILDKRAM